mgnify:CR=1 FL=1
MEYEHIVKIISEQFSINESDITSETSFIDDLGADSLDLVDLVMALEEEFDMEIPEEEVEEIRTVGDAVEYAKAHRS